MLSKSYRGRAPSVPLLPPSQIDEARLLHLAGSLGRVEQSGQRGNSRARTSEERAREFLSRRRRILKNRTTRGFAKTQGRFRGGLGGMRTPVRPSAATLLRLPPCIFGCILTCFSSSPPPPPRFQAKATRPKRHLSHSSSLRAREVSFLWVFWHIRGGRGRGLSGFGVVSERGSRGGAEGK